MRKYEVMLSVTGWENWIVEGKDEDEALNNIFNRSDLAVRDDQRSEVTREIEDIKIYNPKSRIE